MSDILFINACARQDSRTYNLAKTLLDSFKADYDEVNLYAENISPLDGAALEKRTAYTSKKDFSCDDFALAKQFKEANRIVIAAPYWDLSFPSVLKVYFEAVSVSGITFEYSEAGFPVGKCSAETLCYVTTAGGYICENNFGYEYVKALSEKLYGIRDVRFYSAEGLDIIGSDTELILNEAKEKILNGR